MARPSSFESKIGVEDVFKTFSNTSNTENNTQETISINKVGEGSFFSKIIPSLSKTQKIVLSVAAATALIGTISFNNTNTQQKVEETQPASSMSQKIAQNVSKIGAVIKSSEESIKEKEEAIHKHNEKLGVYGTENYKSTKQLAELKGIKAIDSNINDVNSNSKFVTNKNKEHLNKIGKYELQAGLANNQIANLVARHSFRNNNFYEALMVTGEGFTKTTADNIGSTIYHGINTNFQTRDTMRNLAMGVSKEQSVISAYEKLAGVGSADVTKQIIGTHWMPSPKALQMSVMIQENYDRSVETTLGRGNKDRGVQILDNLDDNVRAATRYVAFKVGGGGFAKYKGFINALTEYSKQPADQRTQEMRDKIADNISFKYTIVVEKNGVKEKLVKEDTRATMLVRAMIKSPQAFGYMINEDVKPIYFDGMYKSVTGETQSFDKNDFKTPDNLSSAQDEIEKLINNGFKVQFDPKKDYFLETSKAELEENATIWNKQQRDPAPVKRKYCIGSTTISSSSC